MSSPNPCPMATMLSCSAEQAKGDIRDILDRLAEKHGATVRDVTVAMLSMDDSKSFIGRMR